MTKFVNRLYCHCFFLAVAVLFSANASAQSVIKVPELYSAIVPASGQTVPERDAALKNALLETLIKVTGDRNVGLAPTVNDVLRKAPKLVQQFQFQQSDAGELLLSARFQPNAVVEAVKEAGLSIWDQQRPVTLVWLALRDRNNQRKIVDADAAQTTAAALIDAARTRGIPLMFPLMDLEDRSAISFGDVWGGFEDPVMAASARYDVQSVLIGRVTEGGSWSKGDWWRLDRNQPVESFSANGDSLQQMLAESANLTADRMATQYARLALPGWASKQRVIVNGIYGSESYSQVLLYLEGLGLIETVQVSEVAGQTVTFDIQAEGDARDLEQALDLGSLLLRDLPPAADPSQPEFFALDAGPRLYYRYNRP